MMNKFLEFISFEFSFGMISFCPLDRFYQINLGEIYSGNGFQSYLFDFCITTNSMTDKYTIYFDILYFKLFKRIIKTFIDCE